MSGRLYPARQFPSHRPVPPLSVWPGYHMFLWFILLGTLAAAIVGCFFPRSHAGLTCADITCDEVAFQGYYSDDATDLPAGPSLLALTVGYDYENGATGGNYDGSNFTVPITGVYHFDYGINIQSPLEEEPIYLEFSATFVTDPSSSVLIPASQLTLIASDVGNTYDGTLTGSIDLSLTEGTKVSLWVSNPSVNSTFNAMWFNGHLVTTRV